MVLNRDAILECNDLKTLSVPTPEWGGEVLVKVMSGADRDAYEISIYHGGESNLENLRARFCARTICDADGNRVFTDGDIEVLGRKSANVLGRIFEAAKKLNGIAADSVEEAEKNSEPGLNEDSTSDLPGTSGKL